MSGKFTPSPQIARAWYCVGVARHMGLDPNRLTTEQHDRIHGEFDRMLAEERRAAAEKAWDEGVAAMDPDAVDMVSALNPYRAKETKE